MRSTLHKVISRSAERFRNEKFLSVGAGIVEGPDGQPAEVVFIAPRHPRCVDCLALPAELMSSVVSRHDAQATWEGVAYSDLTRTGDGLPAWLDALAGWDPDSGLPLPAIDWAYLAKLLKEVPPGRILPPDTGRTTGNNESESLGAGGLGVTLLGYGNYAKTVILPALPPDLQIRRIHEIDPLQIPRRRSSGIAWSTAPTLSPGDDSRAVFVAGYHHTHAPLVVEALRLGKDCVVEKPVAVSRSQLRDVGAALEQSRGRLFVCFQKRYSPFIAWAREDLGLSPGQPVNYHAIVFEVPLPTRHWYRWPNSRSRLVSNGCHWIDHFLFLNAWSRPVNSHVDCAPDGTVMVFMSLENSACMTMTLTDIGSGRVGVRDHVELRAGDVTVRIENDSDYVAENDSRILRRGKVNKMSNYHRMYAQVGAAILSDGPGDTPRSVLTSAEVVLDLEEQLARAADRRP